MTATKDMIAEKIYRSAQRVLDEPFKQEVESEDPPMVKLYGWRVMPAEAAPSWHPRTGPWLHAQRYENHPRLGSGRDIRTTEIVWINRECGLARTRNTLYVLIGKEEQS